ncbi:MAG: glycoside hydrolase family 3 protein [Proteobacteria bacterium]|nr:glycoside hydrolase family 3 protein [Pseudomonadota bacterium]
MPGLPELGVPALTESDASLGVANAGRGPKDDATALPSGMALAATWDPELAFASGAMIGKEARQKGFNTLLAGGVNLLRDPRNGRNFEYLGEDPLLAGTLDGAVIAGVQSNHIVSTLKHFALNDQETGRMVLDARIDEAAFRESDLLAFEIALETGRPGSVMCAYNRINGTYGCENPFLLTQVLRKDWHWPGWTMSDWGAVHGVGAAMAGLDQQSGQQLDKQVFFDKPLRAAVDAGEVPAARIHEMAHRYLRSLFAVGAVDDPVKAGGLDTAADGAVAQRAAEEAIVLLKNDRGLLPLADGPAPIVVIGGHADVGVISGGGSSQVIPVDSTTYPKLPGAPQWGGGQVFHPDPPFKAIARHRPQGVAYYDGADPVEAAHLAQTAKVAIVFATQWSTEGMDIAMKLDGDQDALIAAVAKANPNTVVVLETAGPVLMPWRDQVGAIVEAWYGGSRGGQAVARVLFGAANPQGRLPATFPAGESQLARPVLPGADQHIVETLTPNPNIRPFPVTYTEGSDVGYRAFARSGDKPLYPFGFGLSYTSFRYADLKVTGGKTVTVSFTVTNTGAVAGTDTPQVYLTAEPNRTQQRLVAWSKVTLKPGESHRVTLAAPPRMLADWDTAAHGWRVDAGTYKLAVGPDAATATLSGSAKVIAARLKP